MKQWVIGRNQNIYELMCEEWDIYEENWIIKMQSVGLVKQDLTEKEFNQLFDLLTYGEYQKGECYGKSKRRRFRVRNLV